MKVIPYGYRYKVWDENDPDKRRFLVAQGRKCTCGLEGCEHVQAVVAYLKAGGQRAPDEPHDPRPTPTRLVEHFRALTERAGATDCVGDGARAILSARSVSSDAERVAWLKAYALPQMWLEEIK